MKIQDLPHKVGCANYAIAYALTLFAKEEGYKVDQNISVASATTVLSIYGNRSTVLWFYHDRKHIANGESDMNQAEIMFSSLEEFVQGAPPQPTITIGEHIARFRPGGVQVGCTFVPWETVREIAKRDPEAKK